MRTYQKKEHPPEGFLNFPQHVYAQFLGLYFKFMELKMNVFATGNALNMDIICKDIGQIIFHLNEISKWFEVESGFEIQTYLGIDSKCIYIYPLRAVTLAEMHLLELVKLSWYYVCRKNTFNPDAFISHLCDMIKAMNKLMEAFELAPEMCALRAADIIGTEDVGKVLTMHPHYETFKPSSTSENFKEELKAAKLEDQLFHVKPKKAPYKRQPHYKMTPARRAKNKCKIQFKKYMKQKRQQES